jgi:hypothetical protein
MQNGIDIPKICIVVRYAEWNRYTEIVEELARKIGPSGFSMGIDLIRRNRNRWRS